MLRYISTILLLPAALLFFPPLIAQETPKAKETPIEIDGAAKSLEKSLIENDNSKIAFNYELLAQEFADKNELVKAEEYYFKALEVYTSSGNMSGKARVTRNIAKVQESRNKLNAALKNYKAAEVAAGDKMTKTLNRNDYNRLINYDNPALQENYLKSNMALLKKSRKRGEVADVYIQLAKLSLSNTDTVQAIENYNEGLSYATAIPGKQVRIYDEIAKLNESSSDYDEAIAVREKLLEVVRRTKDIDTEITQLKHIASIYFKTGDTDNGITALQDSYKVASSGGKTFEARESLTQLVDYYKSAGDNEAMMLAYEEFIQNMDRIILSDKSLTDAKTFKVTEERIRRLESEKMFRDELISRKNTFNYLLLGSMALLLLLIVSVVKALYSIKSKNKEIALQSLRLEMNPHFIFNSLNSVNQFIAQNNELEANKFLTSYSNLMRNTMENSNKDFVTLGNEIENLKKYLELEHLRFKDKFDYEIIVDESLDHETIWIPNMILQPHLENAIWHGLRYKEYKGLLKMEFRLEGNDIVIIIDDDGIGPTKSNELKTHNQREHTSRGLTNTRERMALLSDLYKTSMTFSIEEKEAPKTGTIVEIKFPKINRP